jgi:hypothetical protein
MNYVYRIYKNGALNDVIICGSLKAESYDDAINEALNIGKVHVVKTCYKNGTPDYHYEIDGGKVGIVVYANAAIDYENTRYKIRREA